MKKLISVLIFLYGLAAVNTASAITEKEFKEAVKKATRIFIIKYPSGQRIDLFNKFKIGRELKVVGPLQETFKVDFLAIDVPDSGDDNKSREITIPIISGEVKFEDSGQKSLRSVFEASGVTADAKLLPK